ncbi:beta-propeller fold lactonase family protein [Streptosporangium sp. NPDC020072]|uniref:lactonase family protein n=1 Tax=Streptosporangium sp. NPDC020072 TaxID=3154788 RepID=UPI003444480D
MMAEVAYIGGYTPDTGGSGTGITVVELGSLTRLGTTPASGPSFLAVHPRLPILYTVGESERGTVGVYALGEGAPTPLGQRPSGGSFPCHLSVDPSGRLLAVANYGDGTVSVHRVGAAGLLTELCSFPYRDGSHAHQTVFGADGVLYVPDLGADEVRRYLTDPDDDRVVPHPDGPVRLAPGMGPRHMTRFADHWYVAGELDGTVRVYDDAWNEVAAAPSSSAPGTNYPSHLEVSGGFLYVANRGPDTVSVLSPHTLEPVAEVACGGSWPRHFAIADNRMYVANQRSDGVAVLVLKDGVPQPDPVVFVTGTPACVLTLP